MDVKTLRAWEHGTRNATRSARRLMDEINADTPYRRKMMEGAIRIEAKGPTP